MMVRVSPTLLALLAILGLGLTISVGRVTAAATSPSPPADAPGYSAATLYNRANDYARDGKPGLAILNYQRAGLLAPSDADIEANLRYVREASHLPAESRNAFGHAVARIDPTAAAWIGVLGVILIGASTLAGPMSIRPRGLRRGGGVVGLALLALTVCHGVLLWPQLHQAVVLAGSTPARVSPVLMGDPLFIIAEGETVKITAEHEDFVLVQTFAGRIGWVARASLAPVVPAGRLTRA